MLLYSFTSVERSNDDIYFEVPINWTTTAIEGDN